MPGNPAPGKDSNDAGNADDPDSAEAERPNPNPDPTPDPNGAPAGSACRAGCDRDGCTAATAAEAAIMA